MKTFRFGATLAAIAVSLTAFATVAHAAVFADFVPQAATADFRWVQSAAQTGGSFFSVNSPSATSPQGVAETFSFLDPSLATLVNLDTTFTLSATVADGTPAQSLGPLFSQPGVNGTFSFIYDGPTGVFGGHSLVQGVTDLLSGTFTGGRITGLGHTGSANLSTLGGTLVYASDVGTFSGDEEFAFNLLGVTPGFGASAGHSLDGFVGNGGGNFSAGVPEPSSWALMIGGFAGLGLMLRSRRSARPLAV